MVVFFHVYGSFSPFHTVISGLVKQKSIQMEPFRKLGNLRLGVGCRTCEQSNNEEELSPAIESYKV